MLWGFSIRFRWGSEYPVLGIFVIFELEGERRGEVVVQGVYELSDPIGIA